LDDSIIAGDRAGRVGDDDRIGSSGGDCHAGDGVGRAGGVGDGCSVFAPKVGRIRARGDDGEAEARAAGHDG
jgi:hypothetical protein